MNQITVTKSDNGLTQVFDGNLTRIFCVRFRPEIVNLVTLNFLRDEIDRRGGAAPVEEWDDLYAQRDRLTRKIEAEAKRIGWPRHMPLAR